jgi:hypothetical protein
MIARSSDRAPNEPLQPIARENARSDLTAALGYQGYKRQY